MALGRTRYLLPVVLAFATVAGVHAAELTDAALEAFLSYRKTAQEQFVARAVRAPVTLPRPGVIIVRPGSEDGIITIPDGLVHHWVGTTVVPGVALADALTASADYASYSSIYRMVVASSLESHDGDTYRVKMRLKGGGGGVSAVLDVRSTVRYTRPAPGRAYAISTADDIRQVEDAGGADERLLPAGDDSGYLWRANTFTRFAEIDGGLFVEMESLGLSRRFPFMLGWIIEPIARRLGRASVEHSLEEFSKVLAASRRAP